MFAGPQGLEWCASASCASQLCLIAATALCELRELAGAYKRTGDRLLLNAGHSILDNLGDNPSPLHSELNKSAGVATVPIGVC